MEGIRRGGGWLSVGGTPATEATARFPPFAFPFSRFPPFTLPASRFTPFALPSIAFSSIRVFLHSRRNAHDFFRGF